MEGKIRLRSLVTNGDGKVSLKRSIAFAGAICLCYGFLFGKWTDPWVFISFPVGLTILYAPQLAINLIQAWKGTKPGMEG